MSTQFPFNALETTSTPDLLGVHVSDSNVTLTAKAWSRNDHAIWEIRLEGQYVGVGTRTLEIDISEMVLSGQPVFPTYDSGASSYPLFIELDFTIAAICKLLDDNTCQVKINNGINYFHTWTFLVKTN